MPAVLKFVFVAGNETFNQGPVSAATAMTAAAQKDIHVQLIYCGPREASWEAAAKLAHSDLTTIDQNYVAQHIASPQDAEILQLRGAAFDQQDVALRAGRRHRVKVERYLQAPARVPRG